MNKVGSKYNAKHFIKEIKARPAIWDATTREYTDRYARTKCWMEIAEIFCDKRSGDSTDKLEYVKILQRKWKNLRDNYTRQLRRVRDGVSPYSDSYRYFKHLLFLDQDPKKINREFPTIQFKTKKKANPPKPLEIENVAAPEFIDIGSRIKEEPQPEDVVEEVSNSNSCNKSREIRESPAIESESDRWFLLSLIEPLKEIPDNMRFTIKMEIMQVIENARLNPANIAINN